MTLVRQCANQYIHHFRERQAMTKTKTKRNPLQSTLLSHEAASAHLHLLLQDATT